MAKTTITIPSRSYAPATRTVAVPDLTTDDNGIEILLTRESWPDVGEIISGVIEFSNDGGATWELLNPFGPFVGGIMLNPRTGQVVPTSGLRTYWPENFVNGVWVPQRPAQVRAVATNTVTLTTAVTVNGL